MWIIKKVQHCAISARYYYKCADNIHTRIKELLKVTRAKYNLYYISYVKKVWVQVINKVQIPKRPKNSRSFGTLTPEKVKMIDFFKKIENCGQAYQLEKLFKVFRKP